jgi:hypothetical protein
MLAVSVPGVLITVLLSGQLRSAAMASQHGLMVDAARDVAVRQALPATPPPRGKAILLQPGAGTEISTDPALFAQLQRDYVLEVPSRTGRPGLDLLVPSRRAPVVESDSQLYWRVRFGPVTVVQPAEPLISRLDYEQLLPSFSLLGLLLLLAATLAEQLPDLGGSVIAELQAVVDLVNRSSRRTRELSASLQQARDELAQTALAITEAIPVGTYTMVLRPGAELARFCFMSERFLEICGLEREAALADPLNAFACVHPDD